MTRGATLWLTAATLALAAPAQAANLAVVLDAGAEDEEAGIDLLGDALNAQGYEVFQRDGADRDAMREALGELAERIEEAERLVIVFAGEVWIEPGEVVLLPADFEGEGRIDAAFDGISLDLLLSIAAERPGRSAVIVAYDADPDDLAEEVEAAEAEETEEPGAAAAHAAEAAQAWSRAEVPQGVLLLAGPREAALDAVTERLLAADLVAASAVEDLEEVRVYGFASPDASFGTPPEAAEAPVVQPEPEPETAEVEVEAEPGPEALAEAGEDALALDQTARRSVQEDLTVLGYSTRGIDGIFGPGTRTAIREWQADEGEEATGFLTAEQIARLRNSATTRTAELAEEAERARVAEEAADAAFWRVTGEGGTAADLRAYLARYPDGIYAAEARARLDALDAEIRAEAEAEDRAAWDAAVATGDVDAYQAYLAERPEGAFRDEAEARIAEIEGAPEREAAEAAAAEREEALGLSVGSRALIESQLAAVGYDVGEADGSFDAQSRTAIREFQARQGLEATGYVDQATVQALIVASLGLR